MIVSPFLFVVKMVDQWNTLGVSRQQMLLLKLILPDRERRRQKGRHSQCVKFWGFSPCCIWFLRYLDKKSSKVGGAWQRRFFTASGHYFVCESKWLRMLERAVYCECTDRKSELATEISAVVDLRLASAIITMCRCDEIIIFPPGPYWKTGSERQVGENFSSQK